MLSLISKLQRKPEHVRKKIALIASAAVTGLIIIVWLVSLGSSLGEPAPKIASDEKEIGPFQALIEGFGGVFENAAETFRVAKSAFSQPSKPLKEAPTKTKTSASVAE